MGPLCGPGSEGSKGSKGSKGSEGDGGGFTASFIRPPSAASRSLSTHKRQVLKATFSSSMLLAHPLPGGGWRAQRDGRGRLDGPLRGPGSEGSKGSDFCHPYRCVPPLEMTPPPSFRPQRSGVEKSPPLMVRVALRWEISRRCVSLEPKVFAPYRRVPPLEMTQGLETYHQNKS